MDRIGKQMQVPLTSRINFVVILTTRNLVYSYFLSFGFRATGIYNHLLNISSPAILFQTD